MPSPLTSRWSNSRPTRSQSKCPRRPLACSARSLPRTARPSAVGALLGQITDGAGGAKPAAAPAKPAAPAPAAAPAAATPAPAQKSAPVDAPLAPSVRKISAESGIDAATVPGSGKDGRVTKGDMLAAIEKAASAPTPINQSAAAVQVRAPSPADDAAREERVKMTRLRQTIARRLKDVQNTAAMLTTFNEVDMTNVMALRSQYKDVFEKKHGTKLGFMGFFTKACVQALKDIPAVNAEIDGSDLIYKNYYHVGVAVGTDKGLVVPVVRDCDHQVDLRHRKGPLRISASAPVTASSRSTKCRAAPSPSPMAASTVR
jgi:2-oxoglutarate dehydrogenase E2 component (dihydrolipoamide succinyltransferase)